MAKKLKAGDLANVIQEVEEWLKTRGDCSRVMLVGALRRGVKVVDRVELIAVVGNRSLCEWFLRDAAQEELIHITPDGCDSDEWKFVHCETGVPFVVHLIPWAQWWTRIVWHTGPERYVAKLAHQALRNGFIFRSDSITAEGTHKPKSPRSERGVYSAIGCAYAPPTERSAS